MKLLKLSIYGVLLLVSSRSFAFPRPQWVWNKQIVDSGNSAASNSNGKGDSLTFSGPSAKFPESASANSEKTLGQSRFIPSAISAISNAISGSASNTISSTSGGALGIFSSVLQSIPQFATQAIGSIFARPPITLPAKDPDVSVSSPISDGGVDGNSQAAPSNCRCITSNSCFLPSTVTGSCDGGRVTCCSASKTLFPSEDFERKEERTISQREVRRGLLQSILRGSGSIVDDTLDLFLTPYLSTEDQQKIATRVIP